LSSSREAPGNATFCTRPLSAWIFRLS
jgi:hypothetical protein